MIKELKYFLYISIIIIFFTLITKYYFSDKNKKYSHVNVNFFKFKMKDNKLNLPLLLSDTNNIIIIVNNENKKNKKNFKFWELLN